MAKWLVIVESNSSDATREREFNDWYNMTHIPDVLEAPGVVRATRYEALDPSGGTSKYLAAYEVEADDLQTVMKAVRQNVEKKAAQGRMSALLKITSTRSYRQVFSRSR